MTEDEPGTAAIVKREVDFSIVARRIRQLRTFQKEIMVRGEDYERYPGMNKDGLLKSGAEKLLMGFSYAVEQIVFSKELVDLEAPADTVGEAQSLTPGHAEFTAVCYLVHVAGGERVGAGIGSASSGEKRYVLARSEFKQKGGKATTEPKVVFADQLNTLRKIAKKRALVDATLTATMSSGLFTQDIEDMAPEARPQGEQGAANPNVTLPPCPKCGAAVKKVPAGVSRKTGNPYPAFWACSERECGWKPSKDMVDKLEAALAGQDTPPREEGDQQPPPPDEAPPQDAPDADGQPDLPADEAEDAIPSEAQWAQATKLRNRAHKAGIVVGVPPETTDRDTLRAWHSALLGQVQDAEQAQR